MKHSRTLLIALFLGVSVASHCEAITNFYVDPDWTGVQVGTASQPWKALSASAWTTINAVLASDDVTIYFSALKADGATQQSQQLFVQLRRTQPSSYRLTVDGYTFYNSNEITPNWLANPDNDIAHAYVNGKVFKIIGGTNPIDGSMALGWTRVNGNDGVTVGGTTYTCIESHMSSADNAPGTGANWTLYWDAHTPLYPAGPISPWQSGVTYRCYVKQNNVTLRGFEITGKRTVCAGGDNLIFEYNWIHDTTEIGPGMTMPDYVSYPDSTSAQIIQRPSTNIIIHHFRIQRTYGEGMYMGCINPDAPAAFNAAHGNQHNHVLVEDFLIDHPGQNGAQGDGVDCKNGFTYLTVRLGEIRAFGYGEGNGIIVPMSATNVNQNILIERNYIHDPSTDATTSGRAGVYAATDQAAGATALYGLNGVTIRNNIIANCKRGIQYSGDNSIPRPAVNGLILNNTVYGSYGDFGLAVGTNVSSNVVENNFVFGGVDPRGQISSTGVTSDYNAHDGAWVSNSEGAHTIALSNTQALLSVVNATNENFHLVYGAPLISAALHQNSFSDDYAGNARGTLWDISGYQYGSTATPTPTPTPTSTPAPTTTPSPTPLPTTTPNPTPTPAPSRCTVPNFIGTRLRSAGILWEQAGFTPGNITISRGRGQRITWQSVPAGSFADCGTATITVGP